MRKVFAPACCGKYTASAASPPASGPARMQALVLTLTLSGTWPVLSRISTNRTILLFIVAGLPQLCRKHCWHDALCVSRKLENHLSGVKDSQQTMLWSCLQVLGFPGLQPAKSPLSGRCFSTKETGCPSSVYQPPAVLPYGRSIQSGRNTTAVR
jgi:hypothetical protein